jgi:hypothetical protein
MPDKQTKATTTKTMFQKLTNFFFNKKPLTSIYVPLLTEDVQQFTSIDEICRKYSIAFDWINRDEYENPESIDEFILTVFNTGTAEINYEYADHLNVYAIYHQHVTKDYATMKELLRAGVKLNSVTSMILLAHYHNHHEIDYRIVTSLYGQAMKQGSIVAGINMANYYFGAGYDDERGETMLLKLYDKSHDMLVALKLAEYYNNKKDGEQMAYFIIEALKCDQSRLNHATRKYVESALATLRHYYSKETTPNGGVASLTGKYRQILEGIKSPNDIVRNELERMNKQ